MSNDVKSNSNKQKQTSQKPTPQKPPPSPPDKNIRPYKPATVEKSQDHKNTEKR